MLLSILQAAGELLKCSANSPIQLSNTNIDNNAILATAIQFGGLRHDCYIVTIRFIEMIWKKW